VKKYGDASKNFFPFYERGACGDFVITQGAGAEVGQTQLSRRGASKGAEEKRKTAVRSVTADRHSQLVLR